MMDKEGRNGAGGRAGELRANEDAIALAKFMASNVNNQLTLS